MKDFKKFMLDENASVAYASGFVKGAASDEVLERHNAFSLNFASSLNESLSEKERIYGIFCAFITSFISFFTLSFSQTAALSVFGLSVSLCVLVYGLCASVLACKNIKI